MTETEFHTNYQISQAYCMCTGKEVATSVKWFIDGRQQDRSVWKCALCGNGMYTKGNPGPELVKLPKDESWKVRVLDFGAKGIDLTKLNWSTNDKQAQRSR